MTTPQLDAPVQTALATDTELADALEEGIAPQAGAGAEALPVWLLPILATLAQRLLDRWLKRGGE